MHKLPYRGEIMRKIIHLSSSVFPFSILFFDVYLCKIIFPIIALIFFMIDYLRINNGNFNKIYSTIFNVVTRKSEESIINGGTYVFISAAICVHIFTPTIAVISLLVLSICDSLAAIIGIPYGRTNFFDKSLEGSLIFFISCLCILYLFSIDWRIAIASTTITTLIESKKLHMDDNILIPLTMGILLSIGSLL